jgi:16S rRNA (uracil1498-N3)-methyltransferase
MNRFYVDRPEDGTAFIRDADQFHHLKNVLRLKVNDAVAAFDSEGNEYIGNITAIEKKQAVIKVTSYGHARRRQFKVAIACAVPKGERMEDVIDQLTQLGVERIIPLMTERVVVRLDNEKKEARLKRWQKIARSAAVQSRRNTLPVIEPVTDFFDAVPLFKDCDLKLIPHLEGERKLIRDVLAGCSPKSIAAIIGPEGDFTPGEVKLALESGFIPVSLGDTILRVATAAVAVGSYLKFALGE